MSYMRRMNFYKNKKKQNKKKSISIFCLKKKKRTGIEFKFENKK